MIDRNVLLEQCWGVFMEAVFYMETHRFSNTEGERKMVWNLIDIAKHLRDYPDKTEAYYDLASQIANCVFTWMTGGKISHIFVMHGTR